MTERLALLLLWALVPASLVGAEPPVRMVPQIGHSQALHTIAYSADGQVVVTGAGDDKVKLWSPDGRLLRTLPMGQYRSLAVSPTEPAFVVGKFNGGVQLWSFDGERLAAPPAMSVVVVNAVAFAPAGDYWVACSSTTRVDYCQVFERDGRPAARFDHPGNGGQKSNIESIAITPDGETIYLGIGARVHAFSRSGQPLASFEATGGFIAALALSPDGSVLATLDSPTRRDGSEPGLRLWTPEGRPLAAQPGLAGTSLAFSRDGQWLIGGGAGDGSVTVLDRQGEIVHGFRATGRAKQIKAMALAPDRSRVLVGDDRINPVRITTWSPSGERLGQFRQGNSVFMAMDVEPVSGLIVTASVDGQLRYWSPDGQLLRRQSSNHAATNLLAIAPGGRALVAGGTEVTIWDADGKALGSMPVHERGSRAIEFTPDAGYLLTGGIDGYVNVIPVGGGARSQRYLAHDGEDVVGLAVHPDGKRFATGSTAGRFRIWDVEGRRLASVEIPRQGRRHAGNLDRLVFTPDGEELIAYTNLREAELAFYRLDGSASRVIGLPVRNSYQGNGLAVSPDGRWLAVGVNRDIGVWDLSSGKLIKAFKGHQGWPGELAFTADSRQLISADRDGVIRIWNVDTGASYAMIADGDEWAIYSDDGYFDASRYGGDLVSMVVDTRPFSVDQFAVRYNRPDLLYQRLGRASVDVIGHFRGYHERRAAELDGQPGELGSAPSLEITGFEQQGSRVELTLAADTRGARRGFLQVYVNDVPLHVGRGREISRRDRTLTEQVELTSGRNRIEVSLTDPRGVESLRAQRYADYAGEQRGDLYFVGIGVSDYQDSALDLQFAHKDVQDLGALLEGQRGHFGAVHRLELTDDQATRAALDRARDFLAGARTEDTVVMLVAGHGGYDYDGVATYYFLPHEADPARLDRTAVRYAELEGLLSGIRPRRKLLLLDTCQSGEFDAATLAALQKVAAEQGLSVRARQRLISEALAQPRTYLYQRDRYIYNDLGRQSGAVVFSSSLANESSLEHERIENGVFTEAVLRTLTSTDADLNGDGFISIPELETGVKLRVTNMTGQLQHPEIERENIYQQIRFPVFGDPAD